MYLIRDERPFLYLLLALIQTGDRCTGFFLLVHIMITIILDIIFPNIFIMWCNTFFPNFCFSKRLVIFCIWYDFSLQLFKLSVDTGTCQIKKLGKVWRQHGTHREGNYSSSYCKIQKLSFLGDSFLVMKLKLGDISKLGKDSSLIIPTRHDSDGCVLLAEATKALFEQQNKICLGKQIQWKSEIK